MKKKLTAIVTTCAMMATMVPTAVLATEAAPTAEPATVVSTASEAKADIEVNVFGFNNDPTRDEVAVQVSGSDARKGCRILAIIDGVADPVLSGILKTSGTNEFYFKKSNIPNIDDPYANNTMTVTIINSAGTEVLFSKTFDQSYASTTAEKVEFTLQDATGNKSRKVDVKFDANYYPGGDDFIRIEGLNENGKVVGRKITHTLDRYELSNDVDDNNMREMKRPVTADLDASATSIRVSYHSGGKEIAKFTKTFSLAPKYGEFSKLELVFENSEIHRGDTVSGTLYYVNKEGKRYDITNEATYRYDDGGLVCEDKNDSKPEFTVKDNAPYNSKVVVHATYGSYGKSEPKLLTVTEKLTNNKVKLSTTSATIGEKTNITFSLVNANGNATSLNFKPAKVNARFLDASDSSAKFNFGAVSFANLTTNGTMAGYVECDKPCTGKIELTFSDDKGNKYRVISDTFAFTTAKDPEKRTVTMTIGSKVIDINGTSKTLDVSPLVYQSRTFVPLRALGDAFGAKTNWDSKTNKITIEYNDKTIVMSPGSKDYTLNGASRPAMDVSPYVVSGANRTMVPIRFVTQAMGFNVESIPYANGLGVEKVVISNAK